ncbi:hypothetical protein [Demequina sp.]|uniref:hypothetical protein n=1 Tax=Demequina sp. TaxID=2050685 RepID=UPI003D1234CF
MISTNESEGGTQSAPLEIPLAPTLFELLVRFMRDQDSDLRLLALAVEHAEDDESRLRRIASELVKRFPSSDPEVMLDFARRGSDLIRAHFAATNAASGSLDGAQSSAAELASEIAANDEPEALAGALLRACLDDADLRRMTNVILVTTIATFEGWLLALSRLIVWADPDSFTAGQRLASPLVSSLRVDLDAETDEAIEKSLKRALRGSWPSWEKLFARFPAPLPPQSALLRSAFDARNDIVHRGGAIDAVADSGDSVQLGVSVAAGDVRAVADELLLVAARLTFALLGETSGSGSENSGARLVNLRYELLLRERFECVAQSEELDPVVAFGSSRARLNADVNRWIALQRLGRKSAYMRQVRTLDRDFPESIYTVARLMLSGQVREARRLSLRLRAAGLISEREWQTWPLLDDIRTVA